MLSSFKTRFQSVIWFLIFTFLLYSTPAYIEILSRYEIRIFSSEAHAEEKPPEEVPPEYIQNPESSLTTSSVSEALEQLSPGVSFSVDDFTGAAHLSYPIVVPPGRGGLAPKLSLSYSRSGGNGWIGVGWDLSVGSVQRRGLRKAVPKYDSSDIFEIQLGGSPQELVCIANCPPGTGNSEYRLKIEGAYLRISYYSNDNHWEIIDKSGLKMTFGKATDSSTRIGPNPSVLPGTYRWCLEKLQDPRANYMEITYLKDQGQIYLAQIQYNGNQSAVPVLGHNHSVSFNLESSNRPDFIYNGRGGFKSVTQKRLRSVEVRTNGNLVRKYEFGYVQPNSRSLLSSITLYGSDGSSTLPATVFHYQANNPGFNDLQSWPIHGVWEEEGSIPYGNFIRDSRPGSPGEGTFTDVIDINGDGLMERVIYDIDSYTTWEVYPNNLHGFDSTPNAWSNPSASESWTAPNYIHAASGTKFDIIDMNGDGLPDRVVYARSYGQDPNWKVYLNTGNGFATTPISWLNPSVWNPSLPDANGNYLRNRDASGYYSDLIDMNGDGLPDRVVYDKDYVCNDPQNCPSAWWKVYLNTGTGFASTPILWENPSAWKEGIVVKGNHIRNSNDSGVYADVVDMNGDGLPDRVVYAKNYPSDLNWTVYLNTGKGFDSNPISWPNYGAWGDAGGNYIRNTSQDGTFTDVLDMNGDGLPDRVVYDRTPPFEKWTVYLNNGKEFLFPGIEWAYREEDWIRLADIDGYGIKADVLDIDGDGLVDRVVYDKTCVSPYNDCAWSVYLNKGPVSDLISKVENGIGGSIDITYAPSTDYTNTLLPFVVQTVRSYTRSDGKNHSYTSLYDYRDGYYYTDSADVEFRGFGKVTSCQPLSGYENGKCAPGTFESKTETRFYQGLRPEYSGDSKMKEQSFKGKPYTQTLTSREGHTKQVDSTWFAQDMVNGIRFPRLDETKSTITDVGATAYNHATKYTYDDYFNVSTETKGQYNVYGQFVPDIQTVFLYDSTFLSKPTDIKVTDGGGNIVSRKWMDYNSTTGNIEKEEVCKSDTPSTGCGTRNETQNSVILYEYYESNPNTKNLKRIRDPRLNWTSLTYDSTQTHVYQTTNALGHITTTVYDPGTGNLTQLVPPHLQNTGFSFTTIYDAFGRKYQETRPDGGYTLYVYNDSGNPSTQYVQKIEHIDAGSFGVGWGGMTEDIRVPGDYDGDGKTDVAIYRTAWGGQWWIIPSSTGQYYGVEWGGDPSDIPVPGDYDGDGKTDIAFYRASTGVWNILPSSTGQPYQFGWGGMTGDIPVPGDYDGDGKTDTAIYRTAWGGAWLIYGSSSGYIGYGWGGMDGDIPVQGDYDGDGKTDVAIYRPAWGGAWLINGSSSGYIGHGWGGMEEDIPVPGDYDGDGKTDVAIFRPAWEGSWWIIPSSTQVSYGVAGTGNSNDQPVLGDFNGDGKTDIADYRSNTGGWYIFTLPLGLPIDHSSVSYFDGMGRSYKTTSTSSRTDGKMIRVDTSYDSIGRVFSKTNPYYQDLDTPYSTYFYYDGLSRNKDTVTTDNYHITTTYQGLRKVVTNQRGFSTAYTSDVYQRLVKVEEDYIIGTGASYSTTEYAYDTLGNLTTVVAAKNQTEQNTTSMFYDSLSKKIRMVDPDMGEWIYGYDKSGNLTSQRDAKSQNTSFGYDALNRMTQKVSERTVTYTYDDPIYPDPAVPYSKGKLVKVSVSGGEINEDKVLEYDVMQRVKRSQKTLGAEIVLFEKGYDSTGRMVSQATSSVSGTTITPLGAYGYGYDVAGNLVYVKDIFSGMDVVWYSNFTALGQPQSAQSTRLNNASVNTSYSYYLDTGRLNTLLTQKLVAGVPTATYQNLNYSLYDGKGNIRTLNDTQNGVLHEYTYDNLDRLTIARGNNGNTYYQSYTYDHIGNIATKSDVGTYSYSYNNKPHAVRNAGSIAAQYDLNGNMTSRTGGGRNLGVTYNYDNKPTLVTNNGINYLQFTYGGNGQRVRKQNLSTGQVTLYFGEGYEKRGSVEIIHLFAGNRRIASIRSDGNGLYDQYYHTNHLGSASVITDINGNQKERIEYFPFGTYRERPDFDPSFPNVNYTFTGQEDEFDELGLYNYGARLYDPVLGRFISPDSIVQSPGDPQTLNRYSYCLNNPLIYTDPSGETIFGLELIAFWFLVGSSMAMGAFSGAVLADINGQNVLKGALIGAVAGEAATVAGLGVANYLFPAVVGAESFAALSPTLRIASASAGGLTAGAISGAGSAAATGGNIWQGALYGGLMGAAIAGTIQGAIELNNWLGSESGGPPGGWKIASQRQIEKYMQEHGIEFPENPDWPTAYSKVIQGFKGTAHFGIDIRNRLDMPSWATEEGTVIEVGPDRTGISRIMLQHEQGYVTKYYHQTPLVKIGDVVPKGGLLGYSEPWPLGPHLHFELSLDGSKFYSIDPLKYYWK